MQLDQYLPVFLFILVGIAVGIVPQVLGYILGPNRPDPAKNSPYECGFEAFEDARMKFDVRGYGIFGHPRRGLRLRVEKRGPGLGVAR